MFVVNTSAPMQAVVKEAERALRMNSILVVGETSSAWTKRGQTSSEEAHDAWSRAIEGTRTDPKDDSVKHRGEKEASTKSRGFELESANSTRSETWFFMYGDMRTGGSGCSAPLF
eukprot:UN2597